MGTDVMLASTPLIHPLAPNMPARSNPEHEDRFRQLLLDSKNLPELTFATSELLRQQIFEFITSENEPGDVIEIGAYTGGSSIFIAAAAALSGRRFHIVDLSEKFLNLARKNVEAMCPEADVEYFLGTASEYFESAAFSESPLLMFLDADHAYGAVRQDIRAILSCHTRPKYWLFHDYSLRGTTAARQDVRVDMAIADELSSDLKVVPWGTQHKDGLPLNAGGDFVPTGGTEAVLIDFWDSQENLDLLKQRPNSVSTPATPSWEALIAMTGAERDDAISAMSERFGYLRDATSFEQRYGEAFSRFSNRYFGTALPAASNVLNRISDERFWDLYFSEFDDALRQLPMQGAVDDILSTKQDFPVTSALNDFVLNAFGLDVYRSRFMEKRIAANRESAFAALMRSRALSPQMPSEIDEMFANFAHFNKHGYVALSDITPTDRDQFLAELTDEIVMQAPHLTKVDGDTPLYRMGLSSAKTPTAMSIVHHRRFLPLYLLICGKPIEPIPAMTEFLAQGSLETAEADANKIWHIDTFHSTFKWWYFFEGVAAAQGPLCYYPNSHALSGRKAEWLTLKGMYEALSSQKGAVSRAHRVLPSDIEFLRAGEPKSFVVPPNTIVITDNFGIHRRSEASERGIIRRALFGWARHELY